MINLDLLLEVFELNWLVYYRSPVHHQWRGFPRVIIQRDGDDERGEYGAAYKQSMKL